MTKPFLDYDVTETAPNPTVSIIWMHGIGDHGSSFVPLVPEFDLTDCPPIRFIFPHAIERPVTANGGYEMSAWFDIYGDFGNATHEDDEGINQSREWIEELIAQEKENGIAAGNIFLAGFSQGCAMALETGLRYPEPLAGIIGLSGYIPMLDSFKERYNTANKEVPVFYAHGSQDGVVPISRAYAAKELMAELGQNVEWHEYEMPHTLCMPEIIDIGDWLRKVLVK